MNSSSKLRSLVVASLLFSTVSVFAINTDIATNFKPYPTQEQNQSNFAENEIIVTFKEGVDVFNDSNNSLSPFSAMSSVMDGFNTVFKDKLENKLGKSMFKVKSYQKLSAMHLKSENNSTEELMKFFSSDEMKEYVKSVSKNNRMALSSSNDSYYSKLWAVENTGQEVNNKSGIDDADMDIVEAWNTTKGDKDVIVAVLDTGVDYTHDDLKENMWSGLEKHGLDFAGDDEGNNDDNPMPDEPYDENGHYHGTHVAGTIGAVGDNSKGISGVAQNVSIMALKVFRPNGYGYSNDIMEALDYVLERVDAGDNIVAINASYGGGDGSQDDATNDAIKKLGEAGVVFCAAAGNDGKDIDAEPTYPASYDAENIITVAASDQDDALASFSNYGANSVDVAAPGTNILSTYPDNQYAYLQGTSMATPNVAGAVALLASQYPNSTVAERKAMILNNVDKKSAFDGKMTTGGRVNINDALKDEPKNTAPLAKDDSTSTAYETAVTIDVLANDSDEDADTLTLKSVGDASNGKVEISDGKVIYTPNDQFEGSDSFEYTISDGEAETTAKVAVTVEEKPNTAPIAKDDSTSTAYETAVTIDVLANDSDEDGDTLTLKSVGDASNGKVEISDGKVVYTPNKEFEGDDHFEYTISDGEKEVNAKVTVTVNKKKEEPNNAPIAQDDKASTAYATTVTIDVLVNDSDEDNDTLNIESVGKAENGKVVIEDGKINYTPNDKFEGEDSFEYTISDGEEKTTAKVLVTVEEKPNSAPVSKDDTATTAYEQAISIDVLANDRDEDGNALSIKSVEKATNGVAEIKAGKILYTPNNGFEGKDSFNYTVTDGTLNSTSLVTVVVEENPNVAPVAQEDNATTAYETAVTIDVLANDSDENGDTLTLKSIGKASNGTVEIQDGKVNYKPDTGFEGSDSFEYTLSDGEAETTAKVTVTVEEKPNTAPVAKDDSATANHNESVTIDVLANDSDEDADKLSIISHTDASNGKVEIEDGKIVYTANKDYSGDDSFTYTMTDGEAKATATVNIKVKEKSEQIKLPVFGGGFGMGQATDSWSELDFSDHDISFGTKEGNEVSLGFDKDNQMVGSIKADGEESKLTIAVPDASIKVDSNGATLIEFKGKEMSITIGSDGTISPKLPTLKNAVLPKKALPLGTELTVSGNLIKFVLPLTQEIKF